MKKKTKKHVEWQHYFENIILIHVIYLLSTKAKGFIHSTRLEVYGANNFYVPWHKPVVYDNFDEQMQHMPICGVSQGDVQISKYGRAIRKV